MFSVGEHVVYGTHGVCRIGELTKMPFGADMREYYVLSPICDPRSTIFVPVDNDALTSQMRRVLTKSQIDELLSSVVPGSLDWIESDAERKEYCTSIIKSGDRYELMRMIDMLYLHQKEMKNQKKHFHVTDERFLREGEKLLHDEFAFVLGISRADVIEYIGERVEA